MVRRALRSTSLRKVKRTTPSGKSVVHHERRKPSASKCGSCGAFLSGVPRLRRAGVRKLSKSAHRPNRPYGGNLCSSCTRQEIKNRILKS